MYIFYSLVWEWQRLKSRIVRLLYLLFLTRSVVQGSWEMLRMLCMGTQEAQWADRWLTWEVGDLSLGVGLSHLTSSVTFTTSLNCLTLSVSPYTMKDSEYRASRFLESILSQGGNRWRKMPMNGHIFSVQRWSNVFWKGQLFIQHFMGILFAFLQIIIRRMYLLKKKSQNSKWYQFNLLSLECPFWMFKIALR